MSVFAITAASDRVTQNKDGTAEAAFTVSNTSIRNVRGIATVQAQNPAETSWLTVKGDAQRSFRPGEASQFTVTIKAPPGAPAGNHPFRLDMADVDNPDEIYTMGPTVAFEVKAETPPPPPFPWWIVAVAVLALAVIGGGTYYYLRHKSGGVPAVTSLPVDAADRKLQEAGLKVGKKSEQLGPAQAAGTVVKQDPTAGSPVREDKTVDLTVGVEGVSVPPIQTLDVVQAILKLQQAKLEVGNISRVVSGGAPNLVLTQNPGQGAQVSRGSAVDMAVSVPPSGPPIIFWPGIRAEALTMKNRQKLEGFTRSVGPDERVR